MRVVGGMPFWFRSPAGRWISGITAAGILVALFGLDSRIHDLVHNPYSGWFMNSVSRLRGIVFALAASLALFAAGLAGRRERLRRAGLAMLWSVLLASLLVAVIKPLTSRPGPRGPEPPVPGESWLAARWGRFPSGHSASTFAAAAALAAFYPPTAPFGYAIGALVGYERIYRGVHNTSDVFAGACIGMIAAWVVIGWLQRREPWRRCIPERGG